MLHYRSKILGIAGLCMGLIAGMTEANAGSVISTTITQVSSFGSTNLKGQSGTFMVYVSMPIAGAPACATVSRFAVNPGTDAGRAQIATILAAQATGRSVALYGLGVCDLWGDTESLDGLVAY